MSEAGPLVPSPPIQNLVRTPLTFGQILDRILRLMRGNLKRFVALGSVPTGAMFAFYVLFAVVLLFSGAIPHPPRQPDFQKAAWIGFPVFVLAGLGLMLAFALYEAAASHGALLADRGISVSFREAYGLAWRDAGRYVWLALLRAFLIGFPLFGTWIVILGGAAFLAYHGATGITPGALFLLVPLAVLLYGGTFAYAVVMGLRLSLAYPISVAEQLPARAALRRSAQLTKGAKGKIFLILLVIYAISYAVLLLVEALCGLVAVLGFLAVTTMHFQMTAPWNSAGIAITVVCAFVVMFVWLAAVWASYATSLAVIYHDQLSRLDLVSPSPRS
jgi:uncharacterized membrane protein